MTKHVMEALGKSQVTIVDGKVVDVTEPVVKYCPLFKEHRGIEEFNKETIKENMEFRIRDFGMCTESRKTKLDYFLAFGISELMSLALTEGSIDAVVLAADGCGTAVLTDPTLVQGMGGRISGIAYTEPIKTVMDAVGRDNVLDPKTAAIDQVCGADKAAAMGFKKFGVTVAFAKDASTIRARYGDRAVIFAVHTTGISREDAETYFDCCDVITACASKHIRDIASERKSFQAGKKVPIYAASKKGEELMLAKLKELHREPDVGLEDCPRPLL
jgi:putative methanogenesis marker protein 8